MELICLTCLFVCVVKHVLTDETKIFEYFKSDAFITIQNHWQTERKSFENALVLILQQNYGSGGMNVYVRNMPDSYKLSSGFYFSDNIVNLILLEPNLQSLPLLIAPDVTFALASNYLTVEARLERMIINTNYLLIRNQSDVIFTAADQDATKKSPFSFRQVQDSGELSIIAQDCKIVGYTISTFSANSVNLGLDTFKVTDCKFSVEIYSSELGSPPVFGPYFSAEQSLTLETMLSKPIRTELMPKLQAAVFTYVNTSAIFGDKLPTLRFYQNNIFKEASNYVSRIVETFLQNTIKKTQGVLQLKPLEFLWNKTCFDRTCGSSVKLYDVILYGLDTAYSARIGGPLKLKYLKLAEVMRFGTMQVRGKIYSENGTFNGEHNFAVELRDVAVNIEMDAISSKFSREPKNIYVSGWRDFEFSILELSNRGYERRISESFIAGYLVNEIPKRLSDHISEMFGIVKNTNEGQIGKPDSDEAVDEPVSDEQLDKPDSDEAVDEPVSGEQLDKPDSDKAIDEPVSGEQLDKPDSDKAVDEPVSNEQLDKEDTDKAVDEPVSNEQNKKEKVGGSDRDIEPNYKQSQGEASDQAPETLAAVGKGSMEDEIKSDAQSLSHPSDNEIK